MTRADREYERRGCAIGSEVTVTGTPIPLLIETEPDALFLHWKRMAAVTLQTEPLDLGKLEFCVRRMRFWQEHMETTR